MKINVLKVDISWHILEHCGFARRVSVQKLMLFGGGDHDMQQFGNPSYKTCLLLVITCYERKSSRAVEACLTQACRLQSGWWRTSSMQERVWLPHITWSEEWTHHLLTLGHGSFSKWIKSWGRFKNTRSNNAYLFCCFAFHVMVQSALKHPTWCRRGRRWRCVWSHFVWSGLGGWGSTGWLWWSTKQVPEEVGARSCWSGRLRRAAGTPDVLPAQTEEIHLLGRFRHGRRRGRGFRSLWGCTDATPLAGQRQHFVVGGFALLPVNLTFCLLPARLWREKNRKCVDAGGCWERCIQTDRSKLFNKAGQKKSKNNAV